MAKRFTASGTLHGAPFSIAGTLTDDAAPPPPVVTDPPPVVDPDDDPPAQGDPGDENPPAPPATDPGTQPPANNLYRYREPQRLKFYDELERDENLAIRIGYSGDRAQDGTTDEVKIHDAFGTGKRIRATVAQLKQHLYGGAAPGDVIELTGGGGVIPGGEWRVSVPGLTVVGEPNATYEFQPGNLPGAKGLGLGMSELDGMFR